MEIQKQKWKKLKNKNEAGITLVALIVTIVILLILAGITLTFAFGENGIIGKAQKAKEETEKGAENSEQLMQNLEDKLNNYTGSGSSGTGEKEEKIYDITSETEKPFETTEHETIKVKDSTGKNVITLPKGFRIKTSESTSVKDGIVISDSNSDSVQGNEFVWIPVGKVYRSNSETDFAEIKLGRYNFNTSTGEPTEVQLEANYQAETELRPNAWAESSKDKDGNLAVTKELATRSDETKKYGYIDNSNHLNDLNAIAKDLSGFVTSVKENGGYYLARYEASYGSGYNKDGADDTAKYGNAKPLSQPSDNKSDSSMNYAPKTLWNFITQINAAKVCRNMYSDTDETKGVKSDLVNSYAWDTAIVYVQEMKSENANFVNKKATDVVNSNLANTGSNGVDKFCNIYDMVANALEWTTEYSTEVTSSKSLVCVLRGGCFSIANYYTSARITGSTPASGNFVGFRPILYVK